MAGHSIAKLHGMKDDRWVIKDKVSQFRGLINLYHSDRKKQIFNASKTRRGQCRQIHDLRSECQRACSTLDNTIFGDKRLVHRVLQHHRTTQLAYKSHLPRSVVEHVDNNNFVKIKELDRLRYKKQQCMKVFTNLRYKLANVSEKISAGDMLSSSQRRSERNILNLIQTMNMRQKVAENSKETFRNILQLLKRDSIYFQTVINLLHVDHHVQCRCVIRATALGQIATEDLANLRDELKFLEGELKISLKQRDKCVKEVRKKVDEMVSNCKMMIRGEDDEQLNKGNVVSTADIELSLELSEIEQIMKEMQDVTIVSTFDDIFPRMEDQLRQRNRLLHQMRTGEEMRNDLLNMRNHAELMLTTLQHAMADITFKYKEDKMKLVQEYEDVQSQMRYRDNEFQEHGNLLCTVRVSLQTLFEMLKCIRDPNEEGETEHELTGRLADSTVFNIPPSIDDNCLQLFKTVCSQLLILMKYASEMKETINTTQAEEMYRNQIIDHLSCAEFEGTDYDYSLIGESEAEDPAVLTRLDVKVVSERIVQHFEKTDILPTGPIERIGRKKHAQKWM